MSDTDSVHDPIQNSEDDETDGCITPAREQSDDGMLDRRLFGIFHRLADEFYFPFFVGFTVTIIRKIVPYKVINIVISRLIYRPFRNRAGQTRYNS